MKFEFVYSRHFDLIFHVLAYFDVPNASNLYDVHYIEKMAYEKAGFEYDITLAIAPLQDYYNKNFERLMLINFLPYYCNSYDEMKNNFLSCVHFTQDDLQFFVIPFIAMLDNESKFFFSYWETLNAQLEPMKQSVENSFTRQLKKYACVFEYFNKSCRILFSFNITKNGRGFYSDTHFAALARFPEKESDFKFSFIQLFHEYTHNFTDKLLGANINMQDGSHDLSEYIVMVTDYYLIKALDVDLIPAYFEWVKQWSGDDLDEDKFLKSYSFDEHLKAEMMAELMMLIESILILGR